jgi:hypothetical protein
VASCPGRASGDLVHSSLEVNPTLARDRQFGRGDRPGGLPELVKEDEEVVRAGIQDPIELASEVAAELS